MMIFYGTKECPDCRNAKKNFDKFHIQYEYIDVLASLKNLKSFLHYRDNNPEVFSRLIQIGDAGLPCLVDGEKVFTDWETYLVELGYADLEYEEIKSACSIDGKGC